MIFKVVEIVGHEVHSTPSEDQVIYEVNAIKDKKMYFMKTTSEFLQKENNEMLMDYLENIVKEQ